MLDAVTCLSKFIALTVLRGLILASLTVKNVWIVDGCLRLLVKLQAETDSILEHVETFNKCLHLIRTLFHDNSDSKFIDYNNKIEYVFKLMVFKRRSN